MERRREREENYLVGWSCAGSGFVCPWLKSKQMKLKYNLGKPQPIAKERGGGISVKPKHMTESFTTQAKISQAAALPPSQTDQDALNR